MDFFLNLIKHFILNITFISHYYLKYYYYDLIGQIIFIFDFNSVFFFFFLLKKKILNIFNFIKKKN